MNIPKVCGYCFHFKFYAGGEVRMNTSNTAGVLLGDGACYRHSNPLQAHSAMSWDCFVSVDEGEAVARRLLYKFEPVNVD